MSDDATNAAPAGVVSADTDPSTSLDDPSNWNFSDPSDEEEAIEEEPAIEDEIEEGEPEAEEADEEPEQSDDEDDAEADPEEPEEGQPEEEASDDDAVAFTMEDGTAVSIKDARAGHMMQADYQRKTQAVAESRKSVEAQAERLQRTVDVLGDYLSQSITPMPDASLAYSDPQAFTAQKAMHEQQMQEMQKLIAMGEEPKGVTQALSEEDSQRRRSEEFAKIEQAFPQVKTPDGMAEFQKVTFGVARELGFSDEELSGAEDSRLFALAYWADKGRKAEAARTTAKRKVAAAPKAAPTKQRRAPGNRDAKKRLARTGSIHDAMKIDFD